MVQSAAYRSEDPGQYRTKHTIKPKRLSQKDAISFVVAALDVHELAKLFPNETDEFSARYKAGLLKHISMTGNAIKYDLQRVAANGGPVDEQLESLIEDGLVKRAHGADTASKISYQIGAKFFPFLKSNLPKLDSVQKLEAALSVLGGPNSQRS